MSHLREVIYTPDAPSPIGPYSQAIRYGGLLYVSGQLSIDAKRGVFVAGSVEKETHRAMQHIKAILSAAGSDLTRVLKVSIFLLRMEDFPKVNKVYGDYFADAAPARETIAVRALPLGAQVELSCIAACDG